MLLKRNTKEGKRGHGATSTAQAADRVGRFVFAREPVPAGVNTRGTPMCLGATAASAKQTRGPVLRPRGACLRRERDPPKRFAPGSSGPPRRGRRCLIDERNRSNRAPLNIQGRLNVARVPAALPGSIATRVRPGRGRQRRGIDQTGRPSRERAQHEPLLISSFRAQRKTRRVYKAERKVGGEQCAAVARTWNARAERDERDGGHRVEQADRAAERRGHVADDRREDADPRDRHDEAQPAAPSI